MTHFRASFEQAGQLDQFYQVQNASVAGFSIGIITIDFNYVKLPGNVANATSFLFQLSMRILFWKLRICSMVRRNCWEWSLRQLRS